MMLNLWDGNSRTSVEISDLLLKLEDRNGSWGEKIYAKVSRISIADVANATE